MEKMDALLFDFDGVVADTESQYTRFWNGVAEKYGAAGGGDFALRIKGDSAQKDIRGAVRAFGRRLPCGDFGKPFGV